MFDINLVTSAVILIKSLSAAVEISELTNAAVMVCTEFLAFARLNIYMIYLAVPIKGLI